MRTNKRFKLTLECLDCGESYSSKDELSHCPLCNGPGEVSLSNYENNGWESDHDFQEDTLDFTNMDNLVFDPSTYND